MRIEIVPYDHPDARRLVGEVQQEYVARYGDVDETPVDAAEFSLPSGIFLIGYLDQRAVASGGWRAQDDDERGFEAGDAELKRMYVVPAARGRGFARLMLGELERSAAEAGRKRVLLETGLAQPEAIALYESAGYQAIPKFGIYRDEPESRCFAKVL